MAESALEWEGGCLCGAVRYKALGTPRWVPHCHCRSCRRATGAALATYAGYERRDFAYTAGAPTVFRSSPGVTRSFCERCGTPLSYESSRWPGEVHVFVCTFDTPEGFTPEAHVFVAEQLPWVHLNDDLPRYRATSGA